MIHANNFINLSTLNIVFVIIFLWSLQQIGLTSFIILLKTNKYKHKDILIDKIQDYIEPILSFRYNMYIYILPMLVTVFIIIIYKLSIKAGIFITILLIISAFILTNIKLKDIKMIKLAGPLPSIKFNNKMYNYFLSPYAIMILSLFLSIISFVLKI